MVSNYPGKFIVIYGINNLGKTTQAKILVDKLNFCGLKAEYLKYPVYDLAPSGAILNNYLRQGNTYNLTPKEAQIIFAFNRAQHEKTLKEKLSRGINVVAEDYVGTGIAWGLGAGVDEKFLKYINSHLLKEDIAFLFDGKRFVEATEKKHQHETNDELADKVMVAHLKLGRELGWIKINANLTIKRIHEQIWNYLLKLLMQSRLEEKIKLNLTKINPHTKFGVGINKPKLKVEKISRWAKMPDRINGRTGFNIYSSDYGSLNPGEQMAIKTGLKITVPRNYLVVISDNLDNLEIQAMTKIIDANFNKEIMINIANLTQDIIHIAPGQKIARLLIQRLNFQIIK